MARSEQSIQDGRTPRGLWWSLIAGFVAWVVDLGLSYILERNACSTDYRHVLDVIGIICLLTSLSGFATGALEFKRFPGSSSEKGGSPFDRAYFQALLGMAFSLSLAVVIIAGSVPRWILSPCE
jgi:hypothetical protein